MKVALIDAAIPPLSRKHSGARSLSKTFLPSIDLMKAYTYCKREQIDVRVLIFREEMINLGAYSVVLVSRESTSTVVSPAIESLLLAYKANICDKTFFESLYDGHEGTDICVMSRSSPLPFSSGKGLGPVVDACPGDVDAYGELLFVRGRLNLIGVRARERIIDMAYGRIMLEDGTWMPPERMVQYAGTDRLEIADPDPASIPDEILAEFLARASARKIRVQFRNPLDLDGIGPKTMESIVGLKVVRDLPLSGYRLDHRMKVLDIADAVGRGKVCLAYDSIGKGMVGEDNMKAIRDFILSMYVCDTCGYRYRAKLSEDARTSRYAALYIAVYKWRISGPSCRMMTLTGYIRWLSTRDEAGMQRISEDLVELFDRFSKMYPDVRKMMDDYTVEAVLKGECVYEGDLR